MYSCTLTLSNRSPVPLVYRKTSWPSFLVNPEQFILKLMMITIHCHCKN